MFVRDRRGIGVYFGRREGAGRGTPFYAEVGTYCSGPEGGWWSSRPPLSVPPDFSTLSSSLTSYGQSATPSSQSMAWGDVSDSSVPLSPNLVWTGHPQDVPEEGSLFHVLPISPGLLDRPSRDAPQFPLEGVLLPSTIDDFSWILVPL